MVNLNSSMYTDSGSRYWIWREICTLHLILSCSCPLLVRGTQVHSFPSSLFHLQYYSLWNTNMKSSGHPMHIHDVQHLCRQMETHKAHYPESNIVLLRLMPRPPPPRVWRGGWRQHRWNLWARSWLLTRNWRSHRAPHFLTQVTRYFTLRMGTLPLHKHLLSAGAAN